MISPRERVLMTVNHERPDRTPRDFWIEAPALRQLQAHLGVADEETILQALGIDFRHLNAIEPPHREIAPGRWQNYWGERFVYRETGWGPMREDLPGALAEAGSDCRAGACTPAAVDGPDTRRGTSPRPTEDGLPAAFETFPWPSPDAFDYSLLAEQVREAEPYALVYGFADVWQRPALVRGWENMFLDMAVHPERVHFLCRKFVDFYKADYTRAMEQSGGRIDFFLLLSDLGSQHGPLISLTMFRELVAPYLREMIEHIHRLGARVFYHSCGAIEPFIPDLIALGVDLLDPLQPVNAAMQPESLQASFGGQVCFHGGIDMQGVLPHGTPEEVRAEVRRYCEVLGSEGGYVLAPTHLFQPDVPPENIVAMYEG